MIVTATNKATGEVIELDCTTPKQIVAAWRACQEYEKAAKSLKVQLKELLPDFVGDSGMSPIIDGYRFRINAVQRMGYDKALLRELLDEDAFDTMMKPDKSAVDTFLAEHVKNNTAPLEWSRIVKEMIPDGDPYQVIKLEKVNVVKEAMKNA